jgi:hypothetical protein
MPCPRCNSNDWKLASLVYQEGLSSIKTYTTGTGQAFTGSGKTAFGFGESSTRATQQTALSQAASPPRGFVFAKVLGFILAVSFFCGLTGIGNPYVCFTLSILSGLGLALVIPGESKSHNDAMTDWSATSVCQRCGTFFIPARDEPFIRGNRR